jgi:hypothetical protein
MTKVLNFFSLFGSFGTLICCALPALFVSLGAGAALTSLLTHVPQLIWLSEHKKAIFIFAGVSLILGGLAQWRARNEPCPMDPVKADACRSSRLISLIVYSLSAVVFLIGAGFAFGPDFWAHLSGIFVATKAVDSAKLKL